MEHEKHLLNNKMFNNKLINCKPCNVDNFANEYINFLYRN